jgi:hypothetical protein
MEIRPSARKHDVPDADMKHVVENALAVFPITGSGGDEAEMHVGFNCEATTVIEVLVVFAASKEPLIIHADTARATYLRRLP